MATVSDYWNAGGGKYYPDVSAALKWLLGRTGPPPSNWLANALRTLGAQNTGITPPTPTGFIECGMSSKTNFQTGQTLSGTIASPFPQQKIEGITLSLPPGLYPDSQTGPDGYPINESDQPLPWGNRIINSYLVTTQFQNYIENLLYTAGSSHISPGDPNTPGVVAKWQANTFFKQFSLIVDHNNNVQIALVDGLTCGGSSACSNTNHPNWPTDFIGHLTGDYQQVWKLLWYNYTTVKWVATGYCFNLIYPRAAYRVDLFAYDTGTNLFYYQGSSSLYSTALGGNQVLNAGTYSIGGVTHLGQAIAALYPTTVSQPSPGSSSAAIPAGWVAHSNTGIGYKLSGYKAQIFLDSGGTETLQEDDIPIIVQPDEYHARAGSSVFPTGAGTPTVRILYDDPISGWTEVYDSIVGVSLLENLVRSYDIPTNDPLYVPNPTSGGSPAIQNRSLVYDNALYIIACSISGNYSSAASVITALTALLDNPGSYPPGSLAVSYDRLFDRVDEAGVDMGAMVWLCLAYSTYMELSGDYSSWAEFQSILNFLLGEISADGDARHDLLYSGYNSSLVRQTDVVVSDNAVGWIALMRSYPVLGAAASSLLKNGTITAAQAATLTNLAATISIAAAALWTALNALYVSPSGPTPGHFPHGVDNTGTVDTSEDAAAQSWMAMVCHANGSDDEALQCIEFAWQTFLLTGQTITLSGAAGSYNETYQTPTPFAGIKPYADSTGGYSSSPDSISQEQSWSLLLALLQLYSIPGLIDYFTGLSTTIDAAIQQLITGQITVFRVTGDGSLLAYSLAERTTWFFYVWPWLTPTAWFYLVSVAPGSILSPTITYTLFPNMLIPTGANQTVDDTQGGSSLGTFSVKVNDPTGVLRALVGEQALLGEEAVFKMGFPGLALGDFVALHTMQIMETGADPDGWITLTIQDLQRYYAGSYLWVLGGPNAYVLGDPTTVQPSGPAWLPNSTPVGDKNPRWINGNPIDIWLAAMQNELGVGQDPALTANIATSAVNTASVSTINPLWKKYVPGDDSTLINPNTYIDIPDVLNLRDTMFSGDWMEFKIVSPMQAKSWLEQNIMRPLGLVVLVRANGQLTLRAMKNRPDQSSTFGFNRNNIIGIPQVSRARLLNSLTARMDVDDKSATHNTAARSFNNEVHYQQLTSIQRFRNLVNNQVEATGVRSIYGGYGRSFLLADLTFRRYSFETPIYEIETQLNSCQVEIKDYVLLSHPLCEDLINKRLGVTSVLCEVIERAPSYSTGRMRYRLLDTRPMQLTHPYLIVCASAGMPDYSSATPEERETYAFVGKNTIF